MLHKLTIKDYALIDHLSLDFKEGFSVITGETGSGKSILMGALGLVLGNRADTSVVRDNAKKCIVEAEFNIADYQLKSIFSEEDLDYLDQSILRRELLASGRSRAFVNDTPVSVQVLKKIGAKLVDIHSQHDVIMLKNNNIQLQALDAFAKNSKLKDKYLKTFLAWRKLTKEYRDLKNLIAKSNMDKDYIDFQLKELSEGDLKVGEKEELESELKKVDYAEHIKIAISQSIEIVSDDPNGMIPSAMTAESLLSKITERGDSYKKLYDRIKSVRLELIDIQGDLENEMLDVEIDPNRQGEIQRRLDFLYRLETKHKVSSTAELMEIESKLSSSLTEADLFQKRLNELEREKEVTHTELKRIADDLTTSRKSKSKSFEKKVKKLLANLSMTKAEVRVDVTTVDDYRLSGQDQVNFMFSANKGMGFQDLSKVASGGELSRVMLAIKSILADRSGLPVLIFDEIDTGISGKVSSQVAKMMKDIAEARQVFAITHQAQVASLGNWHYKVSKSEVADRTITKVQLLNNDERVNEIAEMISGSAITEQSIANASELLSQDV